MTRSRNARVRNVEIGKDTLPTYPRQLNPDCYLQAASILPSQTWPVARATGNTCGQALAAPHISAYNPIGCFSSGDVMLKIRVSIATALVLGGCATPMKHTASGYPEATFMNSTPASVEETLARGCASAGLLVLQQSSNSILCGREVNSSDAFMSELLVGTSYGTTPQRKLQFSLISYGANVRVQAHQWIESQNAFGQMKSVDLNGGAQFNDVQQFLTRLGGV